MAMFGRVSQTMRLYNMHRPLVTGMRLAVTGKRASGKLQGLGLLRAFVAVKLQRP